MRPRLLDLFSGAGGSARGYQQAGFHVTGVDIESQPNYCGDEFIQEDVMEVLDGIFYDTFDAIHASPPCQDYSKAMRHLSKPQPRLIEPVRELLQETGLPWVIENVAGAPLPTQDTLDGRYGVELCGTMFGLKSYRHRLFETSFSVSAPQGCNHFAPALNPHNQLGRDRIYAELGRRNPEKVWQNDLGIEWMTQDEAAQAIPPVYTEFIGHKLMQQLMRQAA